MYPRLNSPSRMLHPALLLLALAQLACSSTSAQSGGAADAGIDSLNARLMRSYRDRDPTAYGALYTDSAMFEWPAFTTVRGSAALGKMAANNWKSQRDVGLRLTVANRRVSADHATEFGAFEQSWRDSSGARMAEFGRYVTVLVRQPDNSWRMDRFFGFEDSTRTLAPAP